MQRLKKFAQNQIGRTRVDVAFASLFVAIVVVGIIFSPK